MATIPHKGASKLNLIHVYSWHMWRIFLMIFAALASTSADASILKKPPVKPMDIAYKDLVCTEQDKAIVYEIISTMADNGKLSLLFKQAHLKEIGAQINHLHPLKFLSAIFSEPHLKS